MNDIVLATPLHIMVTVSDTGRAVKFFTETFGFSVGYRRAREAEDYSSAFQLRDTVFEETYLVLGGMLLCLCSFERPAVIARSNEPFNQVGIKRLCFSVPDLDAALLRVEPAGGRILHNTRYEHANGILITVTDPDGNEFELVQQSH